ncbi:hypothetical protein [Mucilaginibacter sp. HD30]
MKRVFFLFIITFIVQSGYAQQKKPTDALVTDVADIYAKLNIYTDSVFIYTTSLKTCLSGYLFVRFKVDKNRNPVSVQTNTGTPHFLDSLFKKALKHTNGAWKQIPAGKTYLLPVKFVLKDGCAIDTSSKKYSALEWILKQMPGLPELNSTNRSHPDIDFLNMLNFSGREANVNQQSPIDCILLPPYQLANPVSGHPY